MKSKFLYPLLITAFISFGLGLFQSSFFSSIQNSEAADEKKEETSKKEDPSKKEDSNSKKEKTQASDELNDDLNENPTKLSLTKRILSKKYEGCLTDENALKDVLRARKELELAKNELEKKESELAAREKATIEELKKLEQIQKDIATAKGVLDAKEEEKILKLVETFESMSPKAAAQIVSTLDKKLAVNAMSRVSPQKLGKILSAMPTQKSSELTEALAGVVSVKEIVKNDSNESSATTNVVKGGENNNANQQSNKQLVQQSDRAVAQPEQSRIPASTGKGRTPAQ